MAHDTPPMKAPSLYAALLLFPLFNGGYWRGVARFGSGFGIVYLEAMAHHKPCLAARVGGAPEVVLNEETGLVVSPTWEAVRDGLARLTDPALRKRLGEAGYRRLWSRYTYPEFARYSHQMFARLT